MPTRPKKEDVTVTFHYLTRIDRETEGEAPFTLNEFGLLASSLKAKPILDIQDRDTQDRLRYRDVVPIESVEVVNNRTTFGLYKASYSGHAYENTDRGLIPASSVSLRPFFFLLYLSETGRIYLGSQYLGQFGGYLAIRNAICDLLDDPSKKIIPHSVRIGASHYKDAMAKEVRIEISRRNQSIDGGNLFSRGAAIAIKKQSKHDGFESDVKRQIFPLLGQSKEQIQSRIAKLMKDNALLDVEDEEIQDCSIIAVINGRRKVIYLMAAGDFASRLSIDVPLNADGHPTYAETKAAMLEVLEGEVISRKEDV